MASLTRPIFKMMDPTLEPGPLSVRQLMRWHNVDGPMSLADVLRRHRPDISRSLRFLSYNTFLLRLSATLPFDIELEIEAKPDTAARAIEIGQRLSAESYDLACLYEVFQDEECHLVLSGMVTPPQSNFFGGTASSLFLLCKASPIVRSALHVFQQKGKTYHISNPVLDFDVSADSDWYARKGVLMAEIDTGLRYAGVESTPVSIEVYATHLMWGGGVPSAFIAALNAVTFGNTISPVNAQERFNLQMAQVDELVAFYRANHDPRNVAILCGDFNIDGSNEALYRPFIERLSAINLVDAWADSRYPAETRAGQTTRNDDGNGARESDFSHVCAPVFGSAFPDYCNESANIKTESPDGGRFDYIFVERPAPSHRCRIDFSRVRRRQFRRPTPSGGQEFLSDHLGLETTLFVSLQRSS